MNRLGILGLVTATLLTGMAGTAQADQGYYGLGGGDRPGVDFFSPDDRGYYREGRERWRDRRGWDGRDERASCSPRAALRKADRMGIRRAEIVDVGRRTIEVTGRSRGERVWVVFARAPSCPLIG